MFSLQTSFPHISICKNTHIFKVHFPPKSGAVRIILRGVYTELHMI